MIGEQLHCAEFIAFWTFGGLDLPLKNGRRTVALLACAAGCLVVFGLTGSGLESYQSNRTGLARHGAFGPFGPRMCEQLWMLPSGDPAIDLRATVFRPKTGEGPADCGDDGTKRPLVIINHGTDVSTSRAVSVPVFYWLSRWFVERGWVVVLPQRRGHGATGGELVEARDSCSRPDHYAAGHTAADDIEAAANFMTQQPFVEAKSVVAVGVSSGGWATLALGTRESSPLRAVVNFAGGRGAYAWGKPYEICDPVQLAAAAGSFGAESRVPSLWIYAENDSYFPPHIAKAMAAAYMAAGGNARFHLLPRYGREGHGLVDDREGWSHWSSQLSSFLDTVMAEKTLVDGRRPASDSIVSVSDVRHQ